VKNLNLKFINHASVLVSHNDINLITDPWLFDSAFNNGWSLVSESKFTLKDFENITHIWFSHEHPDHFNMTVIKQIPNKEKITVLFQDTLDHRVANKCKELGFKVIEMKKNKTYHLAQRFSVKCVPVPYYDSWLLIKVDDIKILNLNDCQIRTRQEVMEIKQKVGNIYALLTQFGYASAIGDVNDTHMRKRASNDELKKMRLQAEVLDPSYIIPFASFIRFTHKDNLHMNDAMNDIGAVENYINKFTNSHPVILYPNDDWQGGIIDNNLSIKKYRADFAKPITPYTETRQFNFQELVSCCNEYRTKIEKKNNWMIVKLFHKVKYFKPVIIYVTDLNITISFDLINGIRKITHRLPDISMDSDSFAFVFQFEYGMDTLRVNARYRNGVNPDKFFQMFVLGTLNNNGRNITSYAITACKHLIPNLIKKKLMVNKS